MIKKYSTKELVYMSFLIALNIVLSRVASIRISIGAVEGIRIGFGSFPPILAGIMFGPGAGGIVGAIGDIMGYYMNPMGAYIPLFTLSAALTGVIPSLILKLTKRSTQSLWQLIIAIGIGQVITSIILTPYLQLALIFPFCNTASTDHRSSNQHTDFAILVQAIKNKYSIKL